MRDKIRAVLPNDKHIFKQIDYKEIHVVDWKNFDKTRGIEAFDKKQAEINNLSSILEKRDLISVYGFIFYSGFLGEKRISD